MDTVEQIFSQLRKNPLRNRESRFQLARTIQSATNYFSVQEILTFIDEMRGINLDNHSERQMFIEFLQCWMKLEDHR